MLTLDRLSILWGDLRERADKSAVAAINQDLPGCITTGATYEEVQRNKREVIAFHLRGMMEDHEPIPVPQTTAEYADVSIPGSAA